jgi:hypothetical protein
MPAALSARPAARSARSASSEALLAEDEALSAEALAFSAALIALSISALSSGFRLYVHPTNANAITHVNTTKSFIVLPLSLIYYC